MAQKINLTLKIWRQKNRHTPGSFHEYQARQIDTDMSFLEMLEGINEDLITNNSEPVAFDKDCLEGICGSCGAVVNGLPHGPLRGVTLCQLHMRHFQNNDVIVIEPFRSRAFPIIKDLVTDRQTFDRIIAAGGYISIKTGAAPDAMLIPIPREIAELALDAAACIGCGACVAACPNASAMLFTAAKISHLALLPQGQIERKKRTQNMIEQMDHEGFGHCSNLYLCQTACPKQINVANIARLNREALKTALI